MVRVKCLYVPIYASFSLSDHTSITTTAVVSAVAASAVAASASSGASVAVL